MRNVNADVLWTAQAPAVVRQAMPPPAVAGRQNARDRMLAGMRRRVAERQAGGLGRAEDGIADAASASGSDEDSGDEVGVHLPHIPPADPLVLASGSLAADSETRGMDVL